MGQEEKINVFNQIKSGNEKKFEKCYNDMSRFQKDIINDFETGEKDFSEYSLNDLLFDFDSNFVNMILDIERDYYVKECLKKGVSNKANGHTKGVEVVVGDTKLIFNRPRARSEKDFDSMIIPKRTKIMKDITDDVILLYGKNNSVTEIKAILNGMFGIDLSTAIISQMAQSISENVLNWRNRAIPKMYFSLNIDCTYVPVRDKKYLKTHKIPIYLAIGTRLDGHKEIAGVYLGNEDEEKNVIDELSTKDIGESKTFWLTVFEDLKDRGLEECLYVVSDGLRGIKEVVNMEFPNAMYQRCIVHLSRNVSKYVSAKDSPEVMRDFKKIYTAPSLEISEQNYNYFQEKYRRRKSLVKKVEEYFEYIRPLFGVPVNIRKYIYTNNIVESANSKIKRGFYGRGALPNIQSALNIIFVNLKDLEEKWKKSKVNNWEKIFEEITMVHKDALEKYLKEQSSK